MPADTIPMRLIEQGKTRPHSPAYSVRQDGDWVATNFDAYAASTAQAGRALIALGVARGDKTCILGFNRPEWVVFDIASMGVGAAPAGIYTTSSSEEIAYIVSHAGAPIILVENLAQWEKVKEVRHKLHRLKHVVTMEGVPEVDDAMVISWSEFLAKGEDVPETEYRARVEALKPEDLATLIYTSGTTGPPKGVKLSHKNLSWTSLKAAEITDLRSTDSTLSYLPLSHIAEQMFSIHAPITRGYQIYFAESIDAVADNLKEVQPTIFFGVPRIWEKLHDGIQAKLDAATGVKAILLKWARKVGWESNKSAGLHKGLRYRIANKLIFSQLKPAVGLGKARVCVSGAAPIAREVLEFFASLDLVVLEVYGQSEDTGPTSFNLPTRYRFGTVGPAVDGVEVKIADDDEILVRGPNVFMGYYNDPETTASTLSDGWLHSGDLGKFNDGFLSIIGRKKDIIITAGGKNITPKNLESALKNHPLVNEAVVIGDRRKYLTALLTIDPDAGVAWAEKRGAEFEALHENAEVLADIQTHVDEMNERFARVEQIKKFKVLSRNLTVEDGELTPTLKVKRARVHEHFDAEIESLYAS